jgi:uncharacterized membrane protein
MIAIEAPQFLVVVVIAVLYALMPRLTRADLAFSVTVAPGFRDSEAGRAAQRTYLAHLAVHVLIAIGLLLAGLRARALTVAAPIYLLAGGLEAFLAGRRRTRPHAVTPSPVHSATLSARGPMPLAWLFALPPLAVIAGALVVAPRYASLPARLPVHFDASGVPNGFAAKSVASVFGLPLLGLFLCALMFVIARAVWNTRRIQPSGAAAEAEARFRRATVLILLGAQWLVCLPMVLGTLEIAGVVSVAPWVALLPMPFVLAITVWAIWVGQGGSRRAPVPGSAIGDRTADRFWKAGLIYVNRDDPALFVEKRFGVGYTLNFARPGSWILLGLLLVPALFALVLSR